MLVSDSAVGVVWIVVDTLRADHVSCYGGEVSTPNIDSVAASGIRFERAYSPIPITGPSHASMFTGLYPSEHGVRNNTQVLDERLQTVAELLQVEGVQTAAVVSLGNLERRFGFAQGFDTFDDSFPRQWFRNAGEVTESALRSFSSLKPGPFLLFVHYSDPHEPYAPPDVDYPEVRAVQDGVLLGVFSADGCSTKISVNFPPGDSRIRFERVAGGSGFPILFRFLKVIDAEIDMTLSTGWEAPQKQLPSSYRVSPLPAEVVVSNPDTSVRSGVLSLFAEENVDLVESRRRYSREVEYVDAHIGRLLDGLEQMRSLRNVMVIITSDHGEGLGDHDLLGHIHQIYDSLTRVPLVMAMPWRDSVDSVNGGKVSPGYVSLIDIAPTIANHFGLEMGLQCEALPLPGGLIDSPPHPRRRILMMTFSPEAHDDLFGVVKGRYKFIWRPSDDRLELYDLVADRVEGTNLVFELSNTKTELERLRAEADASIPDKLETVELTPEERRQLEALGYVQE
jgi:arylsulfatase A-like enzyme